MAEAALIRVLPQMKATDAHRLNGEQRACLDRALDSDNVNLIVAILKALEQVGDADALPVVRRLAVSGTRRHKLLWLTDSVDPEVRVLEAAQACLPYLQQRVRQQSVSQTLLRPSDATSAAPDLLLRPATTTPDAAEPQQLLRAATQPHPPQD